MKGWGRVWDILSEVGKFTLWALVGFCVLFTIAVLAVKLEKKDAVAKRAQAIEAAMPMAAEIIAVADEGVPKECSDGTWEKDGLTCRLNEARVAAADNFKVLYRMNVPGTEKIEAYKLFQRGEGEVKRYQWAVCLKGDNKELVEWEADYALGAYESSKRVLELLCCHSSQYPEACKKEGLW
ncbi:hypothetical protein I5V52_19100 [Stenotrophomonas maltophilia]|jgi:hypothetical protein|uniref:hypothetical protein n=1 Tax=Stenotrophomonas TaxID=40323 RepID=UPI000C1591F4|nr:MULTISPECIES: hypothetical protein [Stenotrophomonas]MBH1598388.1 hypothetical protein [Stenotrophomonas maltophilia]MBH1604599.1 hypothetical protein [Stenotrophomonas maltophilia]MBH1760919.1 hypothetical protein [Stenotrophomonas maltophilia]MBH1763367.1 hypothetical protein [Stenotrophomonas maltophilia]MBH1772514.1 hypothetical protein [Stenotrophomonas maltophilia]